MAIMDFFSKKEDAPQPTYTARELMQSGQTPSRETMPSGNNMNRKPPLKLEQLYHNDPDIFNAINIWVELVTAPGFELMADQDDEAVKVVEEFMQKSHFRGKLPSIVTHMFIFGNGFSEIIWNLPGTEPIDISWPLDSKLMDFKKDRMTGIPETDAFGNPTTYVMKNPAMSGKDIEVDSARILHLGLNRLSSSVMGIGIIEPIFKDSLSKTVIGEKVGQTEFRRANPLALAKVGDHRNGKKATPDEINEVHNLLQRLTWKTDIVVPDWVDVQFISPETNDTGLEAVKYFKAQEITGLGLPEPFVTGDVKNANRATLDILMSLLQRRVKRIQNDIAHEIETKIIQPLVEINKLSEVPRIVWNEFSPESLSGKADRITRWTQIGAFRPDEEFRKRVRRWEGLPVEEVVQQELKK